MENGFTNYLDFRDSIKRLYHVDIAMWINLTQNNVNLAFQNTGGRMLSAFSTFLPTQTGIEYDTPDVIEKFKREGYIGYKIWYGSYKWQDSTLVKYPFIDDPAHETAFSLFFFFFVFLPSLHITGPNGPYGSRTTWASDPVTYWREIISLERILKRHPNLNMVVAHGFWLMTQDAQLDFLRYVLDTYPNCNLDISATINYANMPSYDNLRDFFIQYQDRLCWSMDISISADQPSMVFINKYAGYWFRFLESDDLFGEEIMYNQKPLKGLNLPREALEKIYYKNALRIYPEKLKESMKNLGYPVCQGAIVRGTEKLTKSVRGTEELTKSTNTESR
jgi:hypothetical protein